MITSDRSIQSAVAAVGAGVVQSGAGTLGSPTRQRRHLHLVAWICLVLACVGASWFSYQYFLVPQEKSFVPDWQGAQWVQAVGNNTPAQQRSVGSAQHTLPTPVAYFRYATNLNELPDSAFVTVAASQTFRLYVNGRLIGSNELDFAEGDSPRAYMYDVDSALVSGVNVIALRVANVDQQNPMLRASFGMTQGKSVVYAGTGIGWLATSQAAAVYPRYATPNAWTTNDFDASSWPATQTVAHPPASSSLAVNPLVYEQPGSTAWISAGGSKQGYFVRQISIPAGITAVWLRLVATGTASVFVNGDLFMIWNAQPLTPRESTSDYLSNIQTAIQYRSGLAMGVYDISAYLHPGMNTIAVYVASPGVSADRAGLNTLSAALALDMLVTDFQGHNAWLPSDSGWHTAQQPVDNWINGSNAALAWPQPTLVGRPGASNTFYLPDSNTPRNTQLIPLSLLAEIILFSTGVVVVIWLLMSYFFMRRSNRPPPSNAMSPTPLRSARHTLPSPLSDVLETASLVYLPALACEAILIVLAHEPQIPQPFPYTPFWGLILILLVGVSYAVVWVNAGRAEASSRPYQPRGVGTRFIASSPPPWGWAFVLRGKVRSFFDGVAPIGGARNWQDEVLAWLRLHWALMPIVLIAIPLICYNLAYEPYWQDELTSYFAAKGILAYGLPFHPSGFLYAKGELYSYILALSMLIFGDQGGAPRIVSVVEYLISLPLLYRVGCYFFNRRVALLATAMLAFSPFALIWGRQVRMYEQAQLLTILVIYLFYKAWQERQRVRLVYLAVAMLVATYLSHEETFIILPAVLLCVLIISRDTTHRLPAVLYQKHWWFAALIAGSLIGLQLLIAYFSHPPILGTDQSQRPLIQLTADSLPFYTKLLVFPTGLNSSSLINVALNSTTPWMTLDTLLAVVGCIWAFRSGDMRAKYCAWFLVISFSTLVFLFTLESDRYIYPILPVYYLMGAYAFLMAWRALWKFARSRLVSPQPQSSQSMRVAEGDASAPTDLSPARTEGDASVPTPHHSTPAPTDHSPGGRLSTPMRVMVTLTVGLACACVLILPMLPVSDYNLFVSRATGLSYHRHYPDYDAVKQYMQQHWQKGDIVIAVSPAISILYYVGHVDYFFSINRALYLFERNSDIIDTPTNSIAPLLNQADFEAVLATNARIWIISDNGVYQGEAAKRFVIPLDFHIVYEGYGSAVYFRGS